MVQIHPPQPNIVVELSSKLLRQQVAGLKYQLTWEAHNLHKGVQIPARYQFDGTLKVGIRGRKVRPTRNAIKSFCKFEGPEWWIQRLRRKGQTTPPRLVHSLLAQLVRALPLQGRGPRFESETDYQKFRCVICAQCSSGPEEHLRKQEVDGSNPSIVTLRG